MQKKFVEQLTGINQNTDNMKTLQTNMEYQVKTLQTSIDSKFETKIKDIKEELKTTTHAI